VVEVRGFEPLTPCMPWAPGWFLVVQHRPSAVDLLLIQFFRVRRDAR